MMERNDSSQSPQPQPQSQTLSRSHSHQHSRQRPPIGRLTSDSQVSQASTDLNSHHGRQKHQKHVVGGGAGRSHARVPSSKALHRQQSSQSSAKLNRRAPSPDPDPDPYRLPMLNNNSSANNTHRRTHSDLRLTSHDASNLQQSFHPNLATKRNRSHVEIGKRPKTTTSNIKRSSSHKEVNKLKGQKSQVHFDLGSDGNDDEWVDASTSASPYLSRRGSVMSNNQSPAKPSKDEKEAETDEHDTEDKRPHTPSNPDPRDSPTNRETAQHNHRITSRLLQRTSSYGAAPHMSTEAAAVLPPSGSPTVGARSGPPSLFGTPKTSTLGASGPEELTSRFVNGDGSGPGSNGNRNSGYFVPAHTPLSKKDTEDLPRARSLVDLGQNRRESISDDENGTALAPRSSRSRQPASQSRTQQKLNLQRASSSMEPTQARVGAGGPGIGLLVGSSDYEDRDPRIGKLLERTGMEYLVVRRYQNPIARSIARLAHLPGAHKNQRIPKQNGANGTHSKAPSESGRLGTSQSMSDFTRSRPVTPRRSTSIRTTGARSSYDGDEDRTHEHDEAGANGDELTALLRNLWDKNNLDLSASQE